MTETIYHVYNKENQLIAHSLSNESLAEKVLNHEYDLDGHLIIGCEVNKTQDASY